jgi:purine-binding chemotaxis protein CheW
MATTAVSTNHPTGDTHSGNTRAGKYLSFALGREEYAIRVLKVREIVKLQHITSVPDTPVDVRGVINLRGKVIPVIDLRTKFGLKNPEDGERTCIIVVEVASSQHGPMGIIVDEVSEVLTLTDADIQDTPDFGSGVETPFLLGLARVKESVKILLDIDQVLSSADLSNIQQISQETAAA